MSDSRHAHVDFCRDSADASIAFLPRLFGTKRPFKLFAQYSRLVVCLQGFGEENVPTHTPPDDLLVLDVVRACSFQG